MDEPKQNANDLNPKIVKALALQQSLNLALLRGLIDITKHLSVDSQRDIAPNLQAIIEKAESVSNWLTELSEEFPSK